MKNHKILSSIQFLFETLFVANNNIKKIKMSKSRDTLYSTLSLLLKNLNIKKKKIYDQEKFRNNV